MKRFLMILGCLMLIVNYCFAMRITMLNVGQGDSILIQTDSQNILIDTSDADERDKLLSELQKAEVTSIDELILTHPHADHIGNAPYLIDNFGVKTVYDNGQISTSRYFTNYIAAIQINGITRKTLSRGDTLTFDEVTFKVLNPADANNNFSINNKSIVGKLIYKDFSMLFTGDAEIDAQVELLYQQDDLKSDVLKANHHGAKNGALVNFVEAVAPEYVLISAGQPGVKGGNVYGHPHKEALAAYVIAKVKRSNILWTYKNGTVIIDTDGLTYTVKVDNAVDWLRDYDLNGVKVKTARRIF